VLNITRLLCGSPTPGDALRYGEPLRHPDGVSAPGGTHFRPVVVWNVTRRCNLFCSHCYTSSTESPAPDELTTPEAFRVIEDLARFGVPVLLFSGGEPLLRQDIYALMEYSRLLGVLPVLSTNGTLLTPEAVAALKKIAVRRIGISLDGLEETHDRFRGKAGSFRQTLEGLRRCVAEGFRVSLRFTLTRATLGDLEGIFDLAEREGVHRLCIYHLAYAGHGRGLLPSDLSPWERRRALDFIFRRTQGLHRRGIAMEVLTVDNHADGPYLLLWMQEHLPERVEEAHRLLRLNGGNSAGIGIGCIDERGFVHPDQFWRGQVLGNVRERPFSAIWQGSHPLLVRLREREPWLPPRCRACRFLPLCNGNLRARAEAATGDPWGIDPACYLTDAERAMGLAG
jgi:radical SAM protein with 4Fe4S-binding SPASM domain